MKTTPLVTIGIPCYNVERYIALSIKSVLTQSYSNIEIIITDDGSTDSSLEIARSFNDSRIKIFSDGKNKGIAFRLNQQISMAKGDFFVRMDADDVMFPDRIEKQVEYMINNKDVDVISGEAIVIDDSNQVIGVRSTPKEPHHFTLKDWIAGTPMTHPTVMGKIEYFRNNGYRSCFDGVEDIDLWLRTCQKCKLMIVPEPVLYYRDPLKFKLKTYLYRRKQSEKLFLYAVKSDIFGHSTANKLIVLSVIKRYLSMLLHSMGLDAMMISRRNVKPYSTKEYESILSSIESKKNG